jgi:hypothetical protein
MKLCVGLKLKDVFDPSRQYCIFKSIIDDYASVNFCPIRRDA